jgi:hypothetical protein
LLTWEANGYALRWNVRTHLAQIRDRLEAEAKALQEQVDASILVQRQVRGHAARRRAGRLRFQKQQEEEIRKAYLHSKARVLQAYFRRYVIKCRAYHERQRANIQNDNALIIQVQVFLTNPTRDIYIYMLCLC